MKKITFLLSILLTFLFTNFSFSQASFTSGTVGDGNGSAWNYNSIAEHPVSGDLYAIWRDGSGTAAVYKLLRWTGTAWTVTGSFNMASVLSAVGFNSASDDVSLAIGSTGTFHVAFRGIDHRVACCAQPRGIVYAYSSNGTSWSFEKVSSYSNSSGWLNTDDPIIRVTSSGVVHIGAQFRNSNNSASYAGQSYNRLYTVIHHRRDAANTWVTSYPYFQGGASNEIGDISMALDTSGNPHFAWQAEVNGSGLDGNLMYTVYTGTGSQTATAANGRDAGWAAPTTIITGATSAGAGNRNDIEIDPTDNSIHIISYAQGGTGVQYSKKTTGSFATTLVTGTDADSFNYQNSFNITPTGTKFLFYADWNTTTFESAFRTASLTTGTTWTISSGSFTPATGNSFPSALLSSSGTAMMMYNEGSVSGSDRTLNYTTGAVVSNTAPTVTSSAATSVTSIGATLNGNVTADGGATVTERGFVYSLTSADSSRTVAESSGSNVTKVIVSGTTGSFNQAISSLLPGTGYSFAPYATNSVGTTEGTTQTFTTSKGALTVTGLTGNNKVYDDSNSGSATGTASLSGIASGHTVTLSGSPVFTFASANVGTGITLNTTGYTISGTDAGKYTLTQPTLSANITAKGLTITGLTGDNKVYDDGTAGSATGTASLSGLEVGDDVTLGGSPVFTFASANVGTGVTLNTTGYTISGTDSGNYTLTQPTLSANITAKTLTITGITGDNKEYDDTTTGSASGTASLSGVEIGDDVSLGGSPVFTFASANIGTGITLNTTGYTISGTDSGNYTLTQPTLSGNITAKGLTITGLTGDNKVYDDGTAGSATGTASLSGLEVGDDVTLGGSPVFTFASANVGTGITLNTTGYTISGTDSGNYTLTQPTLSGNITAKGLTITGLTGDNKVYDDGTAGSATGTASLSGLEVGDDVTLGGSPVFTFASLNVGTGITLNTTGYTISGTDSGNYTLTQPTLSANITAKGLTITGLTGDNKNYDGNTTASATGTASLSGLEAGDDVTLGGSPTFTFTSPNIGTGVTINTIGYTISGTDSGNYTLTQPTLSADIIEVLPTITFADIGKTYGDVDFNLGATSNSAGTISYSIVAGGTGSASLSGTNNATVNVGNAGTVTIRASQVANGIYSSGTKDITLTIAKASLTATAEAKSKTYGDANPTFTIAYTGFTGSDTASVLDTAPTASSTADGTTNVGLATISASGGSDNNYTITHVNGTLTISARPITVSVDIGLAKVIGGTDPALTYSVTVGTVVNGDTPTGALTRTAGEFPGTYPITIGTLSYGSNYNVTFVGRDFTIAFTITSGIAAAAASTAAIVGESTSQPGIIERGVVYSSIDTTPEVGETNVTKVVASLTGPFDVTISGLDPNTTYYFQTYVISSTSRGGKIVPDTYYGGIKSFKTALTEPIANSYSPVDGSTLVDPTTNLTINFAQDIQEGTGNIEIRKVSDDSLIESIDINSVNIDICGSDLEINPSADLPQLTDVYILIPVGVIQNLSADNWPGIFTKTVWNFGTDDTVAPMATATSPLDDATNVPPADNLTVTFDENVVKGTGNILVKRVSDNSTVATLDVTSSEVTIASNVVTINPNIDLPGGTALYIEVASGVFEDQYNNAYAGIAGNSAWNFTTAMISASFDTTASNGLESASSANIPVSLSVPISVTATMDYTITGTATASGTDHTLANGTLTFTPSSTSENITITGIVDDAILEANETVIITLSNPTNTTLGTNTVHTYTITNNDAAAVTIADISGNENGSPMTVTATLDNAVQGGFTIDVSTADGTATTGDSDYSAVSSQTLTFAGNAGETQTFTIVQLGDSKVEVDETLTISQSNLAGTTLGVVITDGATATILNDDMAAITIEDVTGNEDDGVLTLTATLDNPVDGGFMVNINFTDGTATTADSDYTTASPVLLTFSGTAGETQNFTVTPTADTKVEANETLFIGLSNLIATTVDGGNVSTSDGTTVTITNDDNASVTIADISSNEDDGTITVTATLDNAVQGGFTVDVSTSDGTATTGDSDYTSVTSQTLTFTGTAGEMQTFTITPTVDTKLEADETLTITQSNLAATTLGVVITDEATVTINNDDNASVTIADINGNENDGIITVTATLDNAVQGGFTVDVSTADGTATTGDSDYSSVTSQTLTFTGTAGETQTFSITPAGDTKLEADETLTITQSNLAATMLGVLITDGATITINNDDNATITLSEETIGEADGTVSITATLDNAVQGGFTLNASTVNGTAILVNDYTSLTNQPIAFNGTAGETQSIIVTIKDDTVGEEIETFTVVQSSISGASVNISDFIITDTALVIIIDNDAPVVSSVSVPSDGLYGIGDVLDFTITFTNTASTTGTPSIPITIGNTTVEATLNGAITNSLTANFSYTIVEDNLDIDGISVGSAINLNGGTIVGITNIPAILDLNNIANSSNVIIDGVKPTLVITTNAADPTNVGFTATFTFSEAVTGFDVEDITVGNGAASAFTSVSTTVYTATITPTADGDVTIDISANVAQDAATNENTAATQYSVLYDATNPTVAITTNAPDPVNVPFDITVTFSEDVTGFDITDLTVTNGTASAFVATSTTVYTATITPTVNDDITVDIATDAAQDAATNGNDVAQFIIEYDSTPPVQPQVTHISDYSCTGDVTITGDNTLEISGTAERGSTVEVFLEGVSIGTTTAGDNNGFFTYDHTSVTLADGTYNFIAQATDAANNTSVLSNPLTITINSVDTDGDGTPDVCDDDYDGNGTLDAEEDCDGDGIVDHLDSDNSSCTSGITQIKKYGFSPNGDGINEGWVIENITAFPNSLVQVFNRSGKLVFKKKGYQNDWQGASNQISSSGLGTKLPVGPYLFIIDLGDGSSPTRGWLYINY